MWRAPPALPPLRFCRRRRGCVAASKRARPPSTHTPRTRQIIHLVRHGEGWHNVAGRADEAEYKSPECVVVRRPATLALARPDPPPSAPPPSSPPLPSCSWLDAHLTDLGWRQALALRRHIEGLGTAIQPGVIIVSPLTRALETAAGAFGKPCTEANASAPLFMRAQDAVPQRRAAQGAISAAGLPPLVAIEECREHLGVHPCDKRRSISEAVAPCFPAVDFSQVRGRDRGGGGRERVSQPRGAPCVCRSRATRTRSGWPSTARRKMRSRHAAHASCRWAGKRCCMQAPPA